VQKTAEPNEMPFRQLTETVPRNHVLGGAHWQHLTNTIEMVILKDDSKMGQHGQ